MIFYKMSKLFIKGQSLRLKIFILYIGKRRNYLVIANIKSPDAPLHLGVSKPLNNPNPHVYTVSGLKSMNLKKVSLADSKNISRMQENFERNP